jgi:5-methylcytosine-specific restriction endonuclease McrA
MLRKVKRIKLGKQLYRRLMKRVLERDEWRCQRCGSLENLQVHHKIRRSQQGEDTLANLVTLCVYCHTAEHGQLYYGNGRTQATHANDSAPSTSEPDNKPWASIWYLST